MTSALPHLSTATAVATSAYESINTDFWKMAETLSAPRLALGSTAPGNTDDARSTDAETLPHDQQPPIYIYKAVHRLEGLCRMGGRHG